MSTNDPGMQDSAIPLLTEVLDPSAKPDAAPPMRAPLVPPTPATRTPPPTLPIQAPVTAPPARPVARDDDRVTPEDDSGIPVLTIPLQAPVASAPAARPLPTSPVEAPVAVAPVAVAPVAATPPPSAESTVDAMLARLSTDEMDQLQHKLSERILRQLQGRIDFVLEQRVRDSLADVLQLAMGGLTNDIKRGLQQTLEEVVGRAVAQEIARLQSGKR